MTAAQATGKDRARALSEADVLAVLNAFEGSDFATLTLRFDATRVAACKASARTEPSPTNDGPASDGNIVDLPSPSVGTFMLASDGPRPGDRIEEDCVLASIRLLTTEVEVRSEVGGTVAAHLVENGAFVEYGQPLVQLRPDAETSAEGDHP